METIKQCEAEKSVHCVFGCNLIEEKTLADCIRIATLSAPRTGDGEEEK
jgi:hypothetical protein